MRWCLMLFILLFVSSHGEIKQKENKIKIVGSSGNNVGEALIKKLTEKTANHLFEQAAKVIGLKGNDEDKISEENNERIVIKGENNLFDEDDEDDRHIWFLILTCISIPCFLFVFCIFCYYFVWRYTVHFFWLIFVIVFATIMITFLLLFTLK